MKQKQYKTGEPGSWQDGEKESIALTFFPVRLDICWNAGCWSLNDCRGTANCVGKNKRENNITMIKTSFLVKHNTISM